MGGGGKTAKNTGLLVLLKEPLRWRALRIITDGQCKRRIWNLLMGVLVDLIVYYVTF